jgi:hypothetical protein
MRAGLHCGIRRWASIVALAAIGILVAVPESLWASAPAVCLFRRLFDVECFGCGMTRALSAAAHGRLEAALGLNAGVVFVAPALILAALEWIWRRPR